MSNKIPIIDISALINDTELKSEVSQHINKALLEFGFFYIIGHGISETLLQQIDSLSRQFFAQPLEEKLKVRMIEWRGYFGVGEEVTGGNVDQYEGILFGAEKPNEILPKNKQNLYPDINGIHETVQKYIKQMTALGQKLIEGISLSLNLDKQYFAERYTGHEPSAGLRFLNYPAVSEDNPTGQLGVGEHTDWGFLTILRQDNTGGLQVKSKNEWIDATPVVNSFICNIGDALQLVTGGLYRSTLHRVKNPTERNRISMPFFFNPNVNTRIKRIDGIEAMIKDNENDVNLNEDVFTGIFGDYLEMKRKESFPLKN